MATRRLTVYLMREGILEFTDALAPDKPAEQLELAQDSGIDGMFYRPPQILRRPDWVKFVEPLLSEGLGDPKSSSVSGLLLLRERERMFALTFGYGRSLLDLSKIEHHFGLKVALNRIDPTQLRSLDTKAFEDMVVTTTTQVSKNAELPTFGVDVTTDLLRAATGTPRDAEFAKRLSGADSLVINLDTKADALSELCQSLLDAWAEDTYKADFGWIDQLTLVRDADTIDSLDEAVVADLAAGVTAATHMALPEPISWEDIDTFRITGTRDHEYDDLDLDLYLEHLADGGSELTSSLLKSRRVSIRFARTEKFDARWTLYQCLVSEQRLDEVLYVLIEGRWFRAAESLVAEVDAFVGQLAAPGTELPCAEPNEQEGAYNKRVANASPESLLNLDAKIKRPGGAASGIELCDILTKDGEFIHVKRKSRSATLSHLFAQGGVSATTFQRDGVFRDKIRDLIESAVETEACDTWLSIIPASTDVVDRSRYRVVFAVVANSTKSGNDWLPFFSKLNLMQQGRQLQAYGFDLALTRIPVETPATSAAAKVPTDQAQRDRRHGTSPTSPPQLIESQQGDSRD